MKCIECHNPVTDGARFCAHCGVPVGIPSAGSQLQDGRYALGTVLGQGGFGVTYQALDTRLQRTVAIKEFFMAGSTRSATGRVTPSGGVEQVARFEEFREKFLHEAQMLARFKHPGIVQVHDTFEQNGTAYIVMEHLAGSTLRAILRQKERLDPQEALEIMLKVMDALEVIHAVGLFHQDIKPANLVCEGDRAVLIDFGAAIGEGDTSSTVVFTPAYAPPEQYQRSRWVKPGPYTDLYSLGATLYHLLTGQPPPGPNERFLGTDLGPLPDGVSPEMIAAVLGCLQLKYQERVQTVEALRNILMPDQARVPLTPLEHAIYRAAPGTTIEIPAGIYHLSSSLDLTQPIALVGTGPQDVVLRCAAQGQVLRFDNPGLLHLEGITFEHVGGGAANGVVVLQGTAQIHQCAFRGAVGADGDPMGRGLWFRGRSRGEVTQCLSENHSGWGIFVSDEANLLLEANIVQDNGYGGISFAERAQGTARNNVCQRNAAHGIACSEEASPLLEGNTCCDNGDLGIRIGDASRAVARNNVCERQSKYGLYAVDTSAPLLEGNICRGNGLMGIVFMDSAMGIARKNLCEQNQFNGIGVGNQATPLLEENTCRENGRVGIRYRGSAGGTARNNVCDHNHEDGFRVSDESRPDIAGNTCRENGLFGINLDGSSDSRVRDNLCQNNRADGIKVTERAMADLEDNLCRNNEDSGIAFYGLATGTARGNRCEGNGDAGFFVGRQARPLIEGNVSCGNLGAGLVVTDTSEVTVRDNLLEGCEVGIFVGAQASPCLESNTCRNNRDSGITYSGTVGGRALNNICCHNSENGIQVGKASCPALEGNNCHHNALHGIYYFRKSAGISQDNICWNNGEDGIQISGLAHPSLVGNTLLNNQRHAVVVRKTANPTLVGVEPEGLVYLG